MLQLLADGEDYRRIAAALGLSLGTLKNHAKTLCEKLGADNKTHAVAMALRRGLID